jgi:hypothetical protein
MLHLALLPFLAVSTAQSTEPAKAKPAETVTKVEVTTELKETDFGGESTIRVKLGDKTHDVATATGMCRVEAGKGTVRFTVSCFEAGASTDFEVRDVKGLIEVWKQSADESDEGSVSSWDKVWTQKS